MNKSDEKTSVAVFIDVENIHYSTLNNYSETPDWSRIVEMCKTYGRIASIQAFGDWINFSQDIPEIQKNGIQPVFVPLSQAGKSSLDCYLIVSAMKLFFQNNTIDTLILASGDRDYIPLIAELKALGKKVVILAVPGTLSQDLTVIVDDIISYTPTPKGKTTTAAKKPDKEEAFGYVISTIKELENKSTNNRWVNLASIGSKLKKEDPEFTHQKYKYLKLVEMLDDIPEIELKYYDHEKQVALARTIVGGKPDIVHKTSTGQIKTLETGYGFIRPDGESENIFFHQSKVSSGTFNRLSIGDKVSFTTYNTEKGINAENVCKIE